MIIALMGLPGAGKTTLSKVLFERYKSIEAKPVVVKLSHYVERELGHRCSLDEINFYYKQKIDLFGKSYWAKQIIADSFDKTLIIDGVWFTNELVEFSRLDKGNYVGIMLYEERTTLYERGCQTTIQKGEDIFEFERVMNIIRTFDFNSFLPYVTFSNKEDFLPMLDDIVLNK